MTISTRWMGRILRSSRCYPRCGRKSKAHHTTTQFIHRDQSGLSRRSCPSNHTWGSFECPPAPYSESNVFPGRFCVDWRLRASGCFLRFLSLLNPTHLSRTSDVPIPRIARSSASRCTPPMFPRASGPISFALLRQTGLSNVWKIICFPESP